MDGWIEKIGIQKTYLHIDLHIDLHVDISADVDHPNIGGHYEQNCISIDKRILFEPQMLTFQTLRLKHQTIGFQLIQPSNLGV
jgi:hypothetical protein